MFLDAFWSWNIHETETRFPARESDETSAECRLDTPLEWSYMYIIPRLHN